MPRPTETEIQENKKSSLLLNVPRSLSSSCKCPMQKKGKCKLAHLHCIVCRCCLGPINPQLDVSCRCCFLCLENKICRHIFPFLGIIPGTVWAPPPPLSLAPACCPRDPGPCHDDVTLHHACHTGSPEGGALTLLRVPLGPPGHQALGRPAGLLAPHHLCHVSRVTCRHNIMKISDSYSLELR